MAESIFTNPYNARQEQMDALEKSSMDVAQLDGYGAISNAFGLAGGMLGQGLFSAAGGITPEEKNEADIAAVQEIAGRYDLNTPEGRKGAQAEILPISIDAWTEFNKQFKDSPLVANRKTVKGDDGRLYYLDNKERVFPNQKKKVENDVQTILAVDSSWRNETKDVRTDIANIAKARALIGEAANNNAVAGTVLNTQVLELVGNSRMTKAQIDGIIKSGSLPERIANTFSQYISGVPTNVKMGEIRDLLKALDMASKKEFNRIRENRISVLKDTDFPEVTLEKTFGKAYDINPSNKQSPAEKAKAELEKRLKNAQDQIK